MGQGVSRRHSNDTLSLFSTLGNSTTSLATNGNSGLAGVLDSYPQNKSKYNKCHRLSKLKKTISKCFGSNSMHLHESDSDTIDDGRIMNTQQAPTESSEVNGLLRSNDINQDIHELHAQLVQLMELLSRPNPNSGEVINRDISCQTTDHVIDIEHLLRQRDMVIHDQQAKLNRLYLELDSKNQSIERYIRDIAILKSKQNCYSLENRNISQLITFLADLRKREKMVFSDFDKIDEFIKQMSCLSGQNKGCVDNSNVAVINPCSNIHPQPFLSDSSPTFFPHQSSNYSANCVVDPFIGQFEDRKDCIDIKLICFLDHSVSPYISAIPLLSSGITLSHVKHYTNPILPTNAKCRYFFRSMTASSGQTQEELYYDADIVPVQDNKIVVRIRM